MEQRVNRQWLLNRKKPQTLEIAVKQISHFLKYYQERNYIKFGKFIAGTRARSQKLQKVFRIWRFAKCNPGAIKKKRFCLKMKYVNHIQ